MLFTKSLLIWCWAPIYMSLIVNDGNTIINKKRFYSTNINISEKGEITVVISEN